MFDLWLEFDSGPEHLKICLTVEIIPPHPYWNRGAPLTSRWENIFNIRRFGLHQPSPCREQHGTPMLHPREVL
jgi:hypothetical protein